ncbi:MAG: hypothetical protein JWM41_4771 [Gemmatimonadetes bacterium]|nr:hypothetical protein [Gemmatimonadota bacterium]
MTLLEIVAALGIAAMAMLGGILLLDQVEDSGARIARDGTAQASEGNSARTFRRLLLEAEPSFDSTRRFRGDARSIEYFTRCQVPAGWTEPCRVSLAVDSLADSSAVSAQFDNGARFVLERHAGMIGFRFFDAASRDSAWVASWSTSATLPTAVGIVLRSDTIVLPVGASRD